MSRSVRDLAYKTMQFKERYIKEKGKEPTISEIAKEFDVTEEDISLSLDAIQDPVSLQEPIFNDGQENIFIMDQVKDNKNTDDLWTENMTIKQAMEKLMTARDMAKLPCISCEGCGDCCRGMGDTVHLDPYDIAMLCKKVNI